MIHIEQFAKFPSDEEQVPSNAQEAMGSIHNSWTVKFTGDNDVGRKLFVI